MSVCLVPSAIFCKLENEGSRGATLLRQILFRIGKTVYGDFSDVATGLWRGLFEPYAMSRVVTSDTSVSNWAELPSNYTFLVCVCSLICLACKAHAQHYTACPSLPYFSTYLINDTIFGEKMGVFLLLHLF